MIGVKLLMVFLGMVINLFHYLFILPLTWLYEKLNKFSKWRRVKQWRLHPENKYLVNPRLSIKNDGESVTLFINDSEITLSSNEFQELLDYCGELNKEKYKKNGNIK